MGSCYSFPHDWGTDRGTFAARWCFASLGKDTLSCSSYHADWVRRSFFPSIQTTVQFVSTKAGVIRLGINAPEEIAVYREELLEKKDFQPAGKVWFASLDGAANALVNLLNNRLNDSSVGLALLRRQLELGLTGQVNTLDKIEDNVKTIGQRLERLEAERTRPARASKPRTLVVEDDRNECELLAGFLRLAGLDVHTAGDGSDALDYLQKQGKPDVVVLDMILPRCDGPTMVRTIRRDPAYSGATTFSASRVPQSSSLDWTKDRPASTAGFPNPSTPKPCSASSTRDSPPMRCMNEAKVLHSNSPHSS